MRLKSVVLGCIVAVVGGCAIGPDYERPAAPVPAAIGDAAKAFETQLPIWDIYFNDPVLSDLIAQALQYNRDLRVAVARVEEARAQFGVQRADQFPSFDVNAQETSTSDLLLTPIPGQPPTAVARRYDVNLRLLSYEIDFWGRVRRLKEAALANYLGSEEGQLAFRLSLVADVANAYYSARALDERAELARRTATTRAEVLRLVARRAEAGVASRLESLQAESVLETARADAAALARQAANAHNALTLLVGQPISLPPPSGAALEDLRLPAPLPAGLPSSVLLTRPDVLQAEESLVAANANIGAARAAFFPRVSIIGTAGFASRQLDGLFSGDNRTWSFVPSIVTPIFNGGRLSANADIAEARKVIAVAEYEKAIQRAFAEVADVLSDQSFLEQQHEAQQRLVATQDERLRLAGARYVAGLVGYLEVLDAQREQYSARQNLIDVKRARLAAAAEAYKALGGNITGGAGTESTAAR